MDDIERMERYLSQIYKECKVDIEKEAKDFFKKYAKQDKQWQKQVADGEKGKDEYQRWRLLHIAKGERFTNIQDHIAETLTNINGIASDYVNGQLPAIYTKHFNALSKSVPVTIDYKFGLVDVNAIKSAVDTNSDFLPLHIFKQNKDLAYQRQSVKDTIIKGIIKGDSIDKMIDELTWLTNVNNSYAKRIVRTAVTATANKGRLDSYKRAEEDGIEIQKQWVATVGSDRTRDWHLELHGQVKPIDEPFENEFGEIMFPADPNAHPANVYNCRCTMIAKIAGFRKAQVQEAAEEEQVEEPPATTEDAIRTAHDLGVKYAQFEKMPLEQVNNAIDAVRTLPKDCVPKVIASGKDVSTVTGRPLGRKADQWWGVTYDYRAFSLRTMQLGYDATDFDGGLIVGLNTQKFKTLDALTKAKEATNEAYFAKTGRYWSFNTDGKATAYHEIGHCFADVRGLPKGWGDASARWAEESACDLLNKPDEAFAEAWAAYHLGDKRLPDYISAIIGGLK